MTHHDVSILMNSLTELFSRAIICGKVHYYIASESFFEKVAIGSTMS